MIALDGQVFVRFLHGIPLSVRGVTMPNDDGTFSVYINGDLPDERQKAALDHELRHIERDHMYNCDPVIINELEANGARVSPATVPIPAIISGPVAAEALLPVPEAGPPHRELRLPTVSQRERDLVAALSRRLDAEWARDPMGTHARLVDKWLFDIR